MFFDEEMLLDLRLNIMDKYVDKFIIVEANYMHSGREKKLLFDINKFSKYKDKITYILVDKEPEDLIAISDRDTKTQKLNKMIINAKKREIFQINQTQDEISKAHPEDIIIISDIDEIPNLEEINLKEIKSKLIFFKQKMFYYKFNLLHKSLSWYGSKACKKKYFKTAEWLRSTKNKKYPKWRFDILFSSLKYSDIMFVKDGGWHFSNIKKPEELEKKLLNFLHHVDFKESGLGLIDLKRFMNDKKIMYNHTADKKSSKWGEGEKLYKININELPKHIKENTEKYKNWLDF